MVPHPALLFHPKLLVLPPADPREGAKVLWSVGLAPRAQSVSQGVGLRGKQENPHPTHNSDLPSRTCVSLSHPAAPREFVLDLMLVIPLPLRKLYANMHVFIC